MLFILVAQERCLEGSPLTFQTRVIAYHNWFYMIKRETPPPPRHEELALATREGENTQPKLP